MIVMKALLHNPGAKMKMVCECLRAGRVDILLYKVHNYLNHVDLSPVSVQELAHTNGAHWYSDSGGPDLGRIVRTLNVPKGSKAIDIGSGKGGAVISLSEFKNFEEVIGIELSSALTSVAQKNADRLRLTNVRYHCVDAVEYKSLDDITHVYMYNPFPCDIMRKVLGNLAESLAKKPRALTLIYKNPICHQTVLDSNLFASHKEFSFPLSNHAFQVYFHHR